MPRNGDTTPVNTPATLNVSTAVNLTPSAIPAGVYEVLLTHDIIGGGSAVTDQIVAVVKADKTEGAGGAGPVSYADGWPVKTWAPLRVHVEDAHPCIWIRRSTATALAFNAFIHKVS